MQGPKPMTFMYEEARLGRRDQNIRVIVWQAESCHKSATPGIHTIMRIAPLCYDYAHRND